MSHSDELIPEVMSPERLGALKPTGLSFARSFVRRMITEKWKIERQLWQLDMHGQGVAIYKIDTPTRSFYQILSSQELRDEDRNDRAWAPKWELMGAILEDPPTPDDILRTFEAMPRLYKGRSVKGTRVWCRAQRSGRAFEAVIGSLAAGRQPDPMILHQAGYLLRNSGIEGNGAFATPMFQSYEPSDPLAGPYHAQMLAGYVMREFGFDVVEHIARLRNRGAAELAPYWKRYLGLGNATGLGLVLFVNSHPKLISAWLNARNRALAAVLQMEASEANQRLDALLGRLDKCIGYHAQDPNQYLGVFTPSHRIFSDLTMVRSLVRGYREMGGLGLDSPAYPWKRLCDLISRDVDIESLETVKALLIDLYPEVTDQLQSVLRVAETSDLAPEMRVNEVKKIVEREYRWALDWSMDDAEARHYFWYKSQEMEEPRRGPRTSKSGIDVALDLPGSLQALMGRLDAYPAERTVGEFLVDNPSYRASIERVQSLRGLQMHSPAMNMLDERFLPSRIERFVLVTKGLDKIYPANEHNRWVHSLIFHGAPTAAELCDATDDWPYPVLPNDLDLNATSPQPMTITN